MNPRNVKEPKTADSVSCLPPQRKSPWEAFLRPVRLPGRLRTGSAAPHLEGRGKGQRTDTQASPSSGVITICRRGQSEEDLDHRGLHSYVHITRGAYIHSFGFVKHLLSTYYVPRRKIQQ